MTEAAKNLRKESQLAYQDFEEDVARSQKDCTSLSSSVTNDGYNNLLKNFYLRRDQAARLSRRDSRALLHQEGVLIHQGLAHQASMVQDTILTYIEEAKNASVGTTRAHRDGLLDAVSITIYRALYSGLLGSPMLGEEGAKLLTSARGPRPSGLPTVGPAPTSLPPDVTAAVAAVVAQLLRGSAGAAQGCGAFDPPPPYRRLSFPPPTQQLPAVPAPLLLLPPSSISPGPSTSFLFKFALTSAPIASAASTTGPSSGYVSPVRAPGTSGEPGGHDVTLYIPVSWHMLGSESLTRLRDQPGPNHRCLLVASTTLPTAHLLAPATTAGAAGNDGDAASRTGRWLGFSCD
jgi:hypothetical protein